MHGLLQNLSYLLAQGQAQGKGQQNDGSSYVFPMFLFGFALLTYMMFVRPHKQEEQKRRAMVAALKKNDKVVTTGGIYGTVTSVDTDHIVLRVDDEKGIKMKFARASVARVLEAATEKAADS